MCPGLTTEPMCIVIGAARATAITPITANSATAGVATFALVSNFVEVLSERSLRRHS
jgi:hypothetical protein